MSYSEEDPLSEPKNTQQLDLSKLSPQELRIYKMYGNYPLPNRSYHPNSKIRNILTVEIMLCRSKWEVV